MLAAEVTKPGEWKALPQKAKSILIHTHACMQFAPALGAIGLNIAGIGKSRLVDVSMVYVLSNLMLAGLPVAGTSVLRTDNSVRRLRRGYDAMLLVTGFTMGSR